MVLCTKRGQGSKERAVTLEAREMAGTMARDQTRLTTLEARFRADSPAALPHTGLSTHGQTQGWDLYFLKQETKCLGRRASQWEILIPSGAGRASFGSACFFVSSLCLSFSPAAPSSLSCPPAPSSAPQGAGKAGRGMSPGSVWGGPLIPACCRHPAPSICTRYSIKPGIPRRLEKLAGSGLELHVLF